MDQRAQITRWLWRGISLAWVVLVVTGIVLLFVYQPTAGSAWADITGVQDGSSSGLSSGLQQVHRIAALAAVLLPAVLGVLSLSGKRKWPILQAAGVLGLALLGWFSGQFLPWDQLALWAVTVGTNMSGFEPVFSDDVRFVLIDGTEMTTRQIRIWLGVHVVLVPLLAIAGAAFVQKRGSAVVDDRPS